MRPLAGSLIVSVDPDTTAVLNVAVAELPGFTAAEAGDTATENLFAGALRFGLTTNSPLWMEKISTLPDGR